VIVDAADDFERQMSKVGSIARPGAGKADRVHDRVRRLHGRRLRALGLPAGDGRAARFRDTAMKFFDRGRSDFGRPLMTALIELRASGELVIDKPSWAAGQLMGMIEHPIFFMPLVTGDEVQAVRNGRADRGGCGRDIPGALRGELGRLSSG
jgi:hypothetical protein